MPAFCLIFVLVSPHVYPPPLPGISHRAALWKKTEGGEAASTNTTIMMVSHIVQGLAGDLRGGGGTAKKQVVKSGTASQRSGGEVVFADRPLVRPKTPTPSF